MSSPRCKTCRHWLAEEGRRRHDEILEPVDPDTYEPMTMPFEVRQCLHPQLGFCERPVERDGFALADGSEWVARLYTAEDFGCVRHEPAEAHPAPTATLDRLRKRVESGEWS